MSDLEFIIEQTKGKTQNEIEENILLIDLIMFRLIQIAENNSRLSDEFKSNYTEIPWMAIRGMRARGERWAAAQTARMMLMMKMGRKSSPKMEKNQTLAGLTTALR